MGGSGGGETQFRKESFPQNVQKFSGSGSEVRWVHVDALDGLAQMTMLRLAVPPRAATAPKLLEGSFRRRSVCTCTSLAFLPMFAEACAPLATASPTFSAVITGILRLSVHVIIYGAI